MDQSPVHEYAANLTSLIEDVQKNIEHLTQTTNNMQTQLTKHKAHIEDFETLSNNVLSSYGDYKALVTQKIDEIQIHFETFIAEHSISISDLTSQLSNIHNTLLSFADKLVERQNEIDAISTKTIEKMQLLYAQMNESYDAWNNQANQLLLDVDTRMGEMDKKITIKLESAAYVISKNIEPSLKEIIEVLNRKKSFFNIFRKKAKK